MLSLRFLIPVPLCVSLIMFIFCKVHGSTRIFGFWSICVVVIYFFNICLFMFRIVEISGFLLALRRFEGRVVRYPSSGHHGGCCILGPAGCGVTINVGLV